MNVLLFKPLEELVAAVLAVLLLLPVEFVGVVAS
jgi:hypothetical protein